MWRTGWSRFDGVASRMLIELALTVLGRRVGRRDFRCKWGSGGGYAGTLERCSWTRRTTIAPSPTAVAQRLVEPDRTSPAA
jgi:hypothetical protein